MFKRLSQLVCACILISGCAGVAVPPPASLTLPAQYQLVDKPLALTTEAPVADAAWWKSFHDAVLDQLISSGIAQNPDIEQALAHLREAEAFDSSAWTRAVPAADVSIGGGHGTGSDASRGRVGPVMGSADNARALTQLNGVGGIEATWQVDLTGKIANQIKSIHANTEALRAAREFLVSRVTADITQNYLIVRGIQASIKVNQHTLQLATELQQLVNNRHQLGLASELELAQATRDLEKNRADSKLLKVQLALAVNRLAVLVGDYREHVESLVAEPRVVPIAGGELRIGVPLDLLKNRGDIRFAQLKIVAAKSDRLAQQANLLPTLSVTGAVGEQRQDVSALPAISQHIWSVGPAVFWPLLDFGNLDAAIEASRWKEHEALVVYKTTVKQAVSDVESHAEAYSKTLERLRMLEAAVAASDTATKLAVNRFQNGLTDYLQVIDAQRQQDAITREYSDALVQLGTEWAVLQTSLGQGSHALPISDHPFVPKPAVVALFTQLFTAPEK
jgi:NodT family efflux transporter outer membrane factor (OMF) lipoprotein